MTTLYTNIGGAPAVNAAVDLFYNKISAATSLQTFFKDTNMTQQRSKMKKFLTL
ncbi:MAG: hypothetical protein JKY91_03210, partial [Emcibacter sp.]|nr:hypothetical protein [Emcibacter sp.]